MSNQLQITGGAKVRNLEGVLTGTSGVVNALGINVPSGIPQLDGSGKILVSQLPNSVMEYKGTWNVTTNTPYLVDGTGNAGDVYIVEGAATEGTVHNFGSGNITFYNGDQTIYNGSVWQKASGASGAVTSVAISESGDALTITGSPITTSGTINIGFAGTGSQYIKGDGTLATFPTTIDQAKRLITEVYNSTGATLTKGTVVYINGGQGNLPTVTKAQANADNTSAQTYGVVQSDITNNNNGFVVVIGSLTDIDTQAYAVGTQLYLSGTTAGDWTSTKPSAPIHLVYVGIVVRSHPTQGIVEVRIQNGYELEELHDVAISSPINNQGIFYNSSNDLWENKSIATALGYTPANDALVVHLAGTETITGAKTFSNTTTFTDYALMDFGVTLAKTSGSPLYASTVGYANLQLVNAGSVNSLYLIDGNTTKYSSLSFNNAADYSYTFPALNGTLALLEGTQTFGGNKTFSALTAFTFLNGTRMDYGLYLSKGSVPSAFSGSTVNLYSDSGNNNLVVRDNSNTSLLQFQAASSYTYTFPASSGTLALLEGTQTFTGDKTFSGDILATNYYRVQQNATLGVAPSGYSTFGAINTKLNFGVGVAVSTQKVFQFETSGLTNNTTRVYTLPDASGTLALTSNLSSYVPYTGATTNVDLGIRGLFAGYLQSDGLINVKYQDGNIGAGVSYGTLGLQLNQFFLTFSQPSTSTKQIFNFPTTSRTYTLPDASGTLALTSDLGNYVTLATTQTITGAKTFTQTTAVTGNLLVRANSGNIGQALVLEYGTSGTGVNALTGVAMYVNAIDKLDILFTNQGTSSRSARFVGSSITNNSTREYTLPDASGTIALTSDLASYVPTSRTITINGTTQDLSANQTWTITPNVNATNTQDYTATAGQTTFTVTGGYTVGQLAVFYNGSKLAANEYTATNGTTFVLATACQANDIVQAVVSVTGGGIGGSGTTNTLSKWTASGVLGNSLISDNGTTITLGGALSGTSATFSSTLTANGTLVAGLANGNIRLKGSTDGFLGVGESDGKLYLSDWNTATKGLVINLSSGNVGIGTSSPAGKLAVLVGTYQHLIYKAESTYQSSLRFNEENNGARFYTDAGTEEFRMQQQYASTGFLSFYTGTTERMRITSGGDVNIGAVVSAGNRLFVRGSSTSSGDTTIFAQNSAGTNLFYIRNNGTFYTGTAAESPYNLTIAASANVFVFSDGALFRATSSARYKKDIEDINVDTFNLINKIRPVWYRSTTGNDRDDWSWYGFIAEELAEVDPRFVHFGYAPEDYIKNEETGKTELKEGAELRADGVMYDRLTVLLIKGMQEQQAQIEELKALINK